MVIDMARSLVPPDGETEMIKGDADVGVGVFVGVAVRVGVDVDVGVKVGVGVNVAVDVDVFVGVLVGVGVSVTDAVGVLVGVGVKVGVNVGVGVGVNDDWVISSQVSPNSPALVCPPNNTMTRRLLSYAIACVKRPAGTVLGESCTQFVPSHSQVSL